MTWDRNQNINVTNLCVNACGFCGFSKKPGDEGIYFHDREEIQKKAGMAKERQVTEICTVSGLHPDFTAQSYIDVYRWIHEAAPGVHLHASNPMEVAYAARKSRMTTGEVHGRDERCRAQLHVRDCRGDSRGHCQGEDLPGEDSTQEWIRIIREAHALGIKTTATIMYGHCETDADVVAHLAILREIQDETHGFTEFVPLSFIHMNTPLFRGGRARAGATGRQDLLMVAVARLFLDNFRNIQVSWVKEGIKMAQLGLIAGPTTSGDRCSRRASPRVRERQIPITWIPPRCSGWQRTSAGPLRRRTTLYELV